MRLFHYALIPYLPELQFRGQLRETVAIMRDWRDKGKTNHLLINRVMEYPKAHLCMYFNKYAEEYESRYGQRLSQKYYDEFEDFKRPTTIEMPLFYGWHNKKYLRMNLANLAEKHFFGVGKSRISDEEWERLCEGYKQITGEEYQI